MAALDQKSLHDSYIAFKEILTHDVESKCLSECGESVLAMFNQTVHMLPNSNSKEHVDQRSLMDISDNADALHDIAQESLLLYPYKDVPFCWRLLVMDSGLLKASCLLKQLQGNTRLSHAQEIARDIIKVIDTAMIVSGAPGEQRRQVSHKTVDFLQEWLSATAGNQRLKQSIDESHSLTVQSSINISPDHCVHRLDDIPDFIWFVNHIQSPRPTPFIIPKGSIDHWPARSSRPWKSMAYLLSVAGDRIVPVEIGSKYTDADWQQKLMRFEDFVQNHVLQQTTNEPAYLAQHDLFYQIPRLADDIDVPDYCYASPPITDLYERSPPSDVIQNAWFGPSGTISPLHHDPYHNFLAQVVGSKYIRLYAPEQTDLLYPLDGIMSNTSQVDVENIDRERFPLAENANYVECVLKAGELLYIPPKWWHYVRSLETSFSVSFWF